MNKVKEIPYYLKTKYPELYSDTLWGFNKWSTDDKLFENRNNFVTDYNIKKYVKNRPKYIENEYDKLGRDADHIECYITNDDMYYILIVSPYHDFKEENKKYGWKRIYDLYCIGGYTYMKKILRKYCKKKLNDL